MRLIILIMAAAPAARAQQAVASATVTGSVVDTTDALVPGATIMLRSLDTNQVREIATDGQGRFRLLYLPVGPYRLEASLAGFVTTTIDLTLSVGEAVDVPIVIRPRALNETVSVVAEAPLVEAARTHTAGTVTPREIETLPLNGRNYLDLALLVPNVSRTNTRSNERFAETSAVPGTGLSVAGQRNIGNGFIVDGLSANDDAADLAGTYYSEEVIREFQVITSGGGAEFGRAAAGTINIVTQSGTNELRGRAYGFFRDDALDAANALATRKDPLTQRQYGASAGGPIARNRTFWFGNVERTAQDKTGIVTITPANASAVNATLAAGGYAGPRVETGEFPTGYHTTNLFGRVDHTVSASSQLQLRYSAYDVASANARGVGGLNATTRGTRLDNRDQTAAGTLLTTLSPTVLNEARAQYTRSRLASPVNDPVGPAVNISGVASFGTLSFSPTARDLDVLQAADTLTVQRGAHLLKAGADLLYDRVRVDFPGAITGTYTFSSLANFQKGVYVNFQQAFGEVSQVQSNPNLGLFVQDEWQASNAVVVNAGVRYDLQWLPAPIQLDANNVSPRVGAAWSPGEHRTVVRASGGVYFDRIPLRATSNALQRDGTKYKTAVLSYGQPAAPAFPAVLPAFPADVLVAISTIDPAIQNGRSEQAGVEVERAIGPHASATVGYSYLRGHGILMSRNVNVPTLTAAEAATLGVPNLGRPNPDYGNISEYDALGDSWFHGLTFSLTTRDLAWGSVRAAYTLSNSRDTAGNAFFSSPQDANDIAAEKGPSDNDQRHRLIVSGSAGGIGTTLERRLAGIQIGYLFSYATGVPFTVQTGNDRNGDTNANDRPAGVGRNTARLPAASSLDLRASRAFLLASRHRLEFIVEAFNVLNHINVLNVNNIYGTGAAPSASFGQPTLAGDPRQMQVGARWSF